MAANSSENKFSISWHDSAWLPILNTENVLDYFCQRSNTFYDKTCNNEHIKMQRLDPAQLQFMSGVEYALIHTQEPILYVIRKQMRYSQTQVQPLATYYILGGVVYQAPDVGSLINSRLLSSVHKIQSAFAEAQSYSRYTPSKGYWWDFKGDAQETVRKEKPKNKALEASSVFQRQRVNLILNNFIQKFPVRLPQEKTKVEDKTKNDETKSSAVKVSASSSIAKNEIKSAILSSISSNSSPSVTTDTSTRSNAPAPKRRKKE